jgi:hypothetical protein
MGKVICRLRMTSAIATIMAMGLAPLAGQEYRAPRGPDGKPDLNGVWQALNEANYDLEAHVARPAMALRPGPYGPRHAPSRKSATTQPGSAYAASESLIL